MSWADAFAPVEAAYRAVVMQDTWGHLAPKRNIRYSGHILFAVGCFGNDDLNPMTIECTLTSGKHGEIDGSPWFNSTLDEFLQDWASSNRDKHPDSHAGVYCFNGYFRNYEFIGTIQRQQLNVSN